MEGLSLVSGLQETITRIPQIKGLSLFSGLKDNHQDSKNEKFVSFFSIPGDNHQDSSNRRIFSCVWIPGQSLGFHEYNCSLWSADSRADTRIQRMKGLSLVSGCHNKNQDSWNERPVSCLWIPEHTLVSTEWKVCLLSLDSITIIRIPQMECLSLVSGFQDNHQESSNRRSVSCLLIPGQSIGFHEQHVGPLSLDSRRITRIPQIEGLSLGSRFQNNHKGSLNRRGVSFLWIPIQSLGFLEQKFCLVSRFRDNHQDPRIEYLSLVSGFQDNRQDSTNIIFSCLRIPGLVLGFIEQMDYLLSLDFRTITNIPRIEGVSLISG